MDHEYIETHGGKCLVCKKVHIPKGWLKPWRPYEDLKAKARRAASSLAARSDHEKRIDLTYNYIKPIKVEASPMTKDEELRKIWSQIEEKEKEIAGYVAEAKKKGSRPLAYDNAIKDMAKLKQEYEKVRGGKPFDPHNIDDLDQASSRQTHHSLEVLRKSKED